VTHQDDRRPLPCRLAPVVLCLVALCLPALETAFHVVPSVSIAEKRRPLPAPRLDGRGLRAFVGEWVAHFDGTFGLRDVLIRWDTKARHRLLGSIRVSKLVAGRDGWIFYDSEKADDGSTLEDYRGLAAYPPDRLDAIAKTLLDRARWCREHGALYLLFVVPNKETVYSEYLPPSIRRVGPLTRLDQVTGRLGGRAEPVVVDLRPAILRAKNASRDPLYNKGGTHWNEYGAYVGYREIVRTIGLFHPGLQPYELHDFRIEVDPASNEDHWLGLSENLRVRFTLRPEAARTNSNGDVGKVLVVHDSFWESLRPFLALHFPNMACYHFNEVRGRLQSIVEREKPALVLQVAVERYADAVWRE
jgi:alginate O-acetyltransferase complex protein AlgJ